MANIKSAEKRIKVIEKKTAFNRKRKSEVKTYIKNFEAAIEDNNLEEAKEILKKVESKLDKAVSKGIMHKNKASRKVSRLSKRINKAM